MVIAHTDEPDLICRKIKDNSNEWHGVHIDKIAVSVGFAARRDHPEASIDDLEHLADKDMYAEKERYYQENGIERRH